MVVESVKVLVADLACGLALPMTEQAINLSADLIAERFYFLSLDDIRECFRDVMAGVHGEVKFAPNPSQICNWLNIKADSKSKDAARKARTENDERKNVYEAVNSPVIAKVLSEVAERLSVKNRAISASETTTQTQRRDFGQWCLKEFDRRYKLKPGPSMHIRSIIAYGRVFDQDTWVQYKFEQAERILMA